MAGSHKNSILMFQGLIILFSIGVVLFRINKLLIFFYTSHPNGFSSGLLPCVYDNTNQKWLVGEGFIWFTHYMMHHQGKPSNPKLESKGKNQSRNHWRICALWLVVGLCSSLEIVPHTLVLFPSRIPGSDMIEMTREWKEDKHTLRNVGNCRSELFDRKAKAPWKLYVFIIYS